MLHGSCKCCGRTSWLNDDWVCWKCEKQKSKQQEDIFEGREPEVSKIMENAVDALQQLETIFSELKYFESASEEIRKFKNHLYDIVK